MGPFVEFVMAMAVPMLALNFVTLWFSKVVSES